VTTNTGALTGVNLIGVGLMRGTLSGNVAYNNGRGNSGTSGSGFSDSAYGNTWSNNVSYNNQFYGFIDQFSSFVTHTGDKAYNNGQRSAQPGFFSQGALNPSYINITTDDSQASPTQTTGVFWDGDTNNAYADSASIAGSTPLTDQGTGDTWRRGNILAGQPPCFQTAGSGGAYCLGGSATGGTFTANLPAANGPLAIITSTIKKGSGSADYTGTNTTYSNVDGTNLSYTVTIPTGWKLIIQSSGVMFVNTAQVVVFASLFDGVTQLQEAQITPAVIGSGNGSGFSLSWVINGDGASHAITLQAKTSAAADAWGIKNTNANGLPTMTFILTPSN